MKLRTLLPLALFLGLVALFAVGLTLNPREVPSPLVDKPAPAFDLPRLADPELRLAQHDLLGQVTVLNVFASWCGACREEHPRLLELARDSRLHLVGLNYKDERGAALRWLQRHGDPYAAVAFDADGRVGIDYGVYGVPETYIIDRRGVIRMKHIGPVTPGALRTRILPLLEQLTHEPA